MLDSLTEWMSAPLYAAVHGGGQAPRTGRRHHAIAPYGTFTLSDGHTILLAIQNDREWMSFAEKVLGSTAVGTDPRFATNNDRVRERNGTVIIGATGLGKTWLACALANQACRRGFSALYLKMPRLHEELAIAHGSGRYARLLAQLAKIDAENAQRLAVVGLFKALGGGWDRVEP